VNRVPTGGEFRSNLAVGGSPQATELSAIEREICAELGPMLRSEGLFFVGIDVIDGHLSEINVTSPTGVREVESLGGIPLADLTIERLLAGS
jgi:glutathione synthase